jgi:hypothetical protein
MLMTDREVESTFSDLHAYAWCRCRCMELVFQTLAAQSLPIQTWYWQPYGFTESYFWIMLSYATTVLSSKNREIFLPHVRSYQQICHYDQYRNREQEEKQNLDQICRLKVIWHDRSFEGILNRWWMSELKWQDITLKCCSPVRDRGEVVARCRGVLSILTSQPRLHPLPPQLVRRNTADLITTTLLRRLTQDSFVDVKSKIYDIYLMWP